VKTIWKFKLNGPRCEIEMPKGAVVLTAQAQFEVPVIWAEVDPDAPKVRRRFISVPTGGTFDSEGAHYIGTFQLALGGLIFHVYTDLVEYPLESREE